MLVFLISKHQLMSHCILLLQNKKLQDKKAKSTFTYENKNYIYSIRSVPFFGSFVLAGSFLQPHWSA
ncbi:hypothetical protein HanIR_Chr16g0814341 [Helianthus annuus]|nr:hypothetical protein HanIR_Chr16g0814341 [Helianthus annuus]